MKKAKCQKCKYTWESRSKLMNVSCPSCGIKVKIRGFSSSAKEIIKEADEMASEADRMSMGEDLK